MRCYVEPDVWDLDPISLDPDESHYLLDVRRVRPGETVELFDGAGHLAEARIEDPLRRHPRIGATKDDGEWRLPLGQLGASGWTQDRGRAPPGATNRRLPARRRSSASRPVIIVNGRLLPPRDSWQTTAAPT